MVQQVQSAWCLSSILDWNSLHHGRNPDFNDVFAKEIRAIGQAADILVVISYSGKSSNILQAVQAAHERGIHIIALTGTNGSDIASLLDINDKELCVAAGSYARIHEIHLLTLFCLCDLIEEKLFGPIE